MRIQTGRYAQHNITRNERYCLCCNDTDLEDEYHFICICRCYIDLRKKYISNTYYINPSVYKFHKLLVSCDRLVISNVCKYIKEALVVRNTILNNTVEYISPPIVRTYVFLPYIMFICIDFMLYNVMLLFAFT